MNCLLIPDWWTAAAFPHWSPGSLHGEPSQAHTIDTVLHVRGYKVSIFDQRLHRRARAAEGHRRALQRGSQRLGTFARTLFLDSELSPPNPTVPGKPLVGRAVVPLGSTGQLHVIAS